MFVHSLAQFETFFYVVGESSSLNGTPEFMALNPELHSNVELELQYSGLLVANNFVPFAVRPLSIILTSPTVSPSIFKTRRFCGKKLIMEHDLYEPNF